MFPPLRMEMPNLRVTVTIAPSRPDGHKSDVTVIPKGGNGTKAER